MSPRKKTRSIRATPARRISVESDKSEDEDFKTRPRKQARILDESKHDRKEKVVGDMLASGSDSEFVAEEEEEESDDFSSDSDKDSDSSSEDELFTHGARRSRRTTRSKYNEVELARIQMEGDSPSEWTEIELSPARSGLRPIHKKVPRNTVIKQNKADEDTPYELRKTRTPVERFHFSPRAQQPFRHRHHHFAAAHSGTPRRRHYDSSSSSEGEWEERQRRALQRMREKVAPLNTTEVAAARDFGAIQAAAVNKADLQPVHVDTSVSWDQIGGLDSHIQSLKEMVVLPLLYPEVFTKFGISPPRGVLFSGPPGTGKTLVARALANMCSQQGKPVAFFMRKGADVLSKWVGESERSLRMLFEQAKKMEPSIIFFDEIDGLAPVRSTRQDQIHSSIVSTVLAMMDGLDARGQVIVIGATNRIDAIDPALRRPGRFDREFLFPLPNRVGREAIIKIHTHDWHPQLEAQFINDLAVRTVGFSGADLKGLCTESVLNSLRRRYPQIYKADEKLLIDVNQVVVLACDFERALNSVTPSSQRSAAAFAAPLSSMYRPLLSSQVDDVIDIIGEMVPAMRSGIEAARRAAAIEQGDDATPIATDMTPPPPPHNPYLVIRGPGSAAVCAAALHVLEEYPTHSIGMATLHQNLSAKCLEESLVLAFQEAQRSLPAIIFWPQADRWIDMASDSLRGTLLSLLAGLASTTPLLLLCTAADDIDIEIDCRVKKIDPPSVDARRLFFDEVMHNASKQPVVEAPQHQLEELPKAPPPPPRKPTAEEEAKDEAEEDSYLRRLRMHLREIVFSLVRERRYRDFVKPVDPDEVEDYYDIVKQPLCLDDIHSRIDDGFYMSCKAFVKDIDLAVDNCIEYNPSTDPVVRRAEELRDRAKTSVFELDDTFVSICEAIEARRMTKTKYLDAIRRAQDIRRVQLLRHDPLSQRVARARKKAGHDDEPILQPEPLLEEEAIPSPEPELQLDPAVPTTPFTPPIPTSPQINKDVKHFAGKCCTTFVEATDGYNADDLVRLRAKLESVLWPMRMKESRKKVLKKLMLHCPK